MNALVATDHGVYAVDVDEEEVLGLEDADVEPRTSHSAGPNAVEIVPGRPPLRVSHDAGATWREAGGGLPEGRAVAVHPEQPDLMLYAARNRLFVSRDGGLFWHALMPELPEIHGVAWAD
jgi:hypothetical protein